MNSLGLLAIGQCVLPAIIDWRWAASTYRALNKFFDHFSTIIQVLRDGDSTAQALAKELLNAGNTPVPASAPQEGARGGYVGSSKALASQFGNTSVPVTSSPMVLDC